MTAATPLPEEDEFLAAELAFGLLAPADRVAAEAALANDPAFAAAHRRWEAHALALLDGRDEVPPAAVWDAIVARLSLNDRSSLTGHNQPVLRFWQAATALATAAALVLALLTVERRPHPITVASPPARPLVAILDGKGRAAVSVGFDSDSMRLVVAPTRLTVGRHAAQLWLIPSDGTPRSLGVIATNEPQASRVHAGFERLIAPGASLAISLEPAGGSPTGQPTGPIILTGKSRSSDSRHPRWHRRRICSAPACRAVNVLACIDFS